MKTNMKAICIICLIPFLLVGCGGGSSSNEDTNPDGSTKDPYKTVKVEYILNGSQPPLCNKPANITVSKAQKEGDIGIVECYWICGEYEGARPISVMLSFIQEGNNEIWEYDGDVINTPSAECSR